MEVDLEKRVVCNSLVGKGFKVPDAVRCIDYLAQKGARGIECKACVTAMMCRHTTAHIWGAAGGWDGNGNLVSRTPTKW